MVRAAKKIQRKYRAFRIRRATSTFMVRCGVMKNMMRHVLLFGTRKAYHAIKKIRFLLYYGKERVAVRTLISAWRRKRRAQVFSGPNGKMAYLTLAYLNTSIEYIYNPYYSKRRAAQVNPTITAEGEVDSAAGESATIAAAPATPSTPEVETHYAPPPTPSEPHYSNMVIDYIKHKVEIQHAIEQQSRRKHQGGRHLYQSKRPLHVRGKVVMLPTNSVEQSALANVLTGEKMVYAQDNHRHFSKEEIARLGYGGKLITPMYTRDQLPDELIGIWGPKSFADVILMIVDMKRIAVENPNLVDDGSLTGAAASPIVSRMSGKFKRREHNGKAYFVNQNGETIEGPRLNSPGSATAGGHRDTNMSVMSTMSAMSTSSHVSVTPSHRVLDSAGSKGGGNRLHHFPEDGEGGRHSADPKKSAKNGAAPLRSARGVGAAAAAGGKKPGSATNNNKKQQQQPTPKAGGSVVPTETPAVGNKSTTIHEEGRSAATKSGVSVSSLRISTELNPEDLTLTMPLSTSSESLKLTPLSAAFKQTFGFLNSTSTSFSAENGEPEPEVPEVEVTPKSLRFANDFVMKARTTALMLKMINSATAPPQPAAAAAAVSATNSAAADATRDFINQARSSLVLVKSSGESGAGGVTLSTTPSFMSAKALNNKATDVTGDILKAARRSVMQTTLNNRKAAEPKPTPSLESIAAQFTTVKNKGISFNTEAAATSFTDNFLLKARSSVMMMPHTPPGKPTHVTKKAAAFSMAPSVTLESLSLLYDTAAASAAPAAIKEEEEEEEKIVQEPPLVVGSELETNSIVELPANANGSEYSMNFTGMLGSLVDDPDFNIQLENSDFAIQIDDANVVNSPMIDHLKSKLPVVNQSLGHAKAHESAATNTLPSIKNTAAGATGGAGSNSRPVSGNGLVTHYPDIHLSDDEGSDHKKAAAPPPVKPNQFKPAKPVTYHVAGEVRPRPGRKIV